MAVGVETQVLLDGVVQVAAVDFDPVVAMSQSGFEAGEEFALELAALGRHLSLNTVLMNRMVARSG